MKKTSTKKPTNKVRLSNTTASSLASLPIQIKFLSLVVIVVILAIVGTFGYTAYKQRDLTAQARGVTPVRTTTNGIDVSMCKRTSGNVAVVRVYFIARNADRPETRVKVFDYTRGGYQGDIKNSGWFFSVLYTTVFTTTQGSVSASFPGYQSKLYPVGGLVDCP